MTEESERSALSDEEREMIQILRESKLINFDQIGPAVARILPDLFDRRAARGNYIISIVRKVLHIVELPRLERIGAAQDLKEAGRDLRS